MLPRRSLGLNGTQPAPGRKNSHQEMKRVRWEVPAEFDSSAMPSTVRAGMPAARSTATHAADRSWQLPVPAFMAFHAPLKMMPRGNPFSTRVPSASTAVKAWIVARTSSLAAIHGVTVRRLPPLALSTNLLKSSWPDSMPGLGLRLSCASAGHSAGQVMAAAARSSTTDDQHCSVHAAVHLMLWPLASGMAMPTAIMPCVRPWRVTVRSLAFGCFSPWTQISVRMLSGLTWLHVDCSTTGIHTMMRLKAMVCTWPSRITGA